MIEQTVEIALGSKEAFENGNVGRFKRRVTADRVVNATGKARRSAKPARQPKTPRVGELLRKALEWRRQLDAGEVATQAEIARREGVTRARVTQIMGLLRLPPEIRELILALPAGAHLPGISERALRAVTQLKGSKEQTEAFASLRG